MTSKIICVIVIMALCFIDKYNGSKPHIVVIIADDLGWNDVSFHGANQIQTPNIDALAYNGVILNRHYTQPTCTPSRTAFLTGNYPIRSGMQGNPLQPPELRGIPLNFTLLPEHLKRLGYVTRMIGKWHTGYFTINHTPARRGFDSFFGYYNGYIQYFRHTINYFFHTGHDVHRDYPNKLSTDYPRGYFTDIITQEVEDVISKHNQEIPLYLQIAHLAPHSSDNQDPLEVRDLNEMNFKFGYIRNLKRRKFAAMVNALDESVGRTVMALKKANMLQNSIILFMSDNGAQTEGFMENAGSNYPLRGLKFTTFEGGIRAVACIYSPLIEKAPRVSNQMIHITDWLPTFYSAAGGNIADLGKLDGVDQWLAIKNERENSRNFLLVDIDKNFKIEAAILGQFKLVRGFMQIYSKHYGDPGNDKSSPDYNLNSILFSLSNQAIYHIANFKLNSTTIINLRSASQVHCQNSAKFSVSFGNSLFNIINDPCENTDVSSQYPEAIQILNNIINAYRQVVVHRNLFFIPDAASYPENFHGSWMPWIKNL